MSAAANAPQVRAEILKLSRMLGRDPEQLAYLERVSLADLRDLREQTTEVLWAAHGPALTRLAAAGRLLPAGLTATISERAFGPLLSARLAGLMEPARAVEVASRLPAPFLAELAIELDPRRASTVIAMIAPQQIAAITRELVRRGEYVTMGGFVGHLGDGALSAALAAMDDPTVLRVAFVLEDKDRLQRLMDLLPVARLPDLIEAAAQEGLWLEALDVLGHLSSARRSELAAWPVGLDDAACEAIVTTVVEHGLWSAALVLAATDAGLQGKLAQRVPALAVRQRRQIARGAAQDGPIERFGLLGRALTKA